MNTCMKCFKSSVNLESLFGLGMVVREQHCQTGRLNEYCSQFFIPRNAVLPKTRNITLFKIITLKFLCDFLIFFFSSRFPPLSSYFLFHPFLYFFLPIKFIYPHILENRRHCTFYILYVIYHILYII